MRWYSVASKPHTDIFEKVQVSLLSRRRTSQRGQEGLLVNSTPSLSALTTITLLFHHFFFQVLHSIRRYSGRALERADGEVWTFTRRGSGPYEGIAMLSFSHMGKPFCIFRSMGCDSILLLRVQWSRFSLWEIFPLRRNFFLFFFIPSTKIWWLETAVGDIIMDTVLRSSYVELQQEHETTILIISKENYGTKGVTSSEATTKRSSIKQRAIKPRVRQADNQASKMTWTTKQENDKRCRKPKSPQRVAEHD